MRKKTRISIRLEMRLIVLWTPYKILKKNRHLAIRLFIIRRIDCLVRGVILIIRLKALEAKIKKLTIQMTKKENMRIKEHIRYKTVICKIREIKIRASENKVLNLKIIGIKRINLL